MTEQRNRKENLIEWTNDWWKICPVESNFLKSSHRLPRFYCNNVQSTFRQLLCNIPSNSTSTTNHNNNIYNFGIDVHIY